MGGAIKAAAVLRSGGVDDLLRTFAAELRQKGTEVRGLVQSSDGPDGAFDLIDLSDGRIFPIGQRLGSGSQSCRLDLGELAEASIVLLRAVTPATDLLIAGKFGKTEAYGKGFAGEMLAALASGIPVLTTVAGSHTAAWRAMTGGLGRILPPRRAALEAWWQAPRTGFATEEEARRP